MFSHASVGQHLIACLVIAYIAFCFLYGHSSLRSRRNAAASAHGMIPFTIPTVSDVVKNGRMLSKAAVAFAVPAAALVGILSVAGRERTGVIEASNLFAVPIRADATVAFLARGENIKKGDVVARFASEAIDHRVAGLKAKRQELVATRDAVKTGTMPQSSDALVRIQSTEQRLAQFDQKLSEIERVIFSGRQQLLSAHVAWQRSRSELVARQPALEQLLASEQAEHETAIRALARVKSLRDGGYATLTQLDRAQIAETVAKHRLNTTRQAVSSTRIAIATLDTGYDQSRALLEGQMAKLEAKASAVSERRAPVEQLLEQIRPSLAASDKAATEQRAHQVAAANSRIDELDTEIAAVIAQTHVKSPISGRVLYRNEASSTLSGALPLMVVASNQGFLMRIDLPRDEVGAFEREMANGRKFDVLVDDSSARRLVPANLVRIDDNGFDPKRVTAVFAVEMPEDMLVRMALKGTSPRGYLRWSPPVYAAVTDRIAGLFAKSPTALASKARQPTTTAPIPAKARPQPPVNAIIEI